jgi:hypothetical protein
MTERVARLATIAALNRAERVLVGRLIQLENRVQNGDEASWSAYVETTRTLRHAVADACSREPW